VNEARSGLPMPDLRPALGVDIARGGRSVSRVQTRVPFQTGGLLGGATRAIWVSIAVETC